MVVIGGGFEDGIVRSIMKAIVSQWLTLLSGAGLVTAQ
jgi:hypothetical protein